MGLPSDAGDAYTAPDEHCEILDFSGFGRYGAWGFFLLCPTATAATAASTNR
jgi:hypothetical protein